MAFEDLFRREYDTLVRVVAPIVGSVDEAEAVVQEAFLKAFARWRRLRTYDRPGAWVRRVAIRDAVRVAERTKRAVRLNGDLRSAPDDLDGSLDLYRAIQRLPARQCACVVLHHLAGWPAAEVAEALGCREATVRVHLHRARVSLAGTLADEEENSSGS